MFRIYNLCHKTTVLSLVPIDYYEMTEDQFNECLSMLKRSYPDYNDLESAKNKFMNEINKSEVSQ